MVEFVPLLLDISPLVFFLRTSSMKTVLDFKTVKESKGAIVSELGRLPSQIVGKASQISGDWGESCKP